jgi:segregation and condensation protein B
MPENETENVEPNHVTEEISAEEFLASDAPAEQPKWPAEDAELTAMLEAVIYVTDQPLGLEQIAAALEQSRERIKRLLDDLVAEWQKPHHGLAIREVAGGYIMATKPEHHDAVRQFVKSLKPPVKLSLPALETLAVIAYKQPVTAPEVMDIRGVQGAGVLKTLIERKLIAPAGRKNVLGKPILYKTTKEFLVQFGLKDLSELPSVKEFEELARFATTDPEPAPTQESAPPQEAQESVPQEAQESQATEEAQETEEAPPQTEPVVE